MDMARLAVHLGEFSFEIPAELSEYSLHGVIVLFPENLLPVFGDEVQMNVKIKYAMFAVPYFG
jgi:hypothetical protein